MKENFCTQKIVRGLFLNLMLGAVLTFAPTYIVFAEGPEGKNENNSGSTSQTLQSTNDATEGQDKARVELPHLTPDFLASIGLEHIPNFFASMGLESIPEIIFSDDDQDIAENQNFRQKPKRPRSVVYTKQGKAAKEYISAILGVGNRRKTIVISEVNVIFKQIGKPCVSRAERRSIGLLYNRLGGYGSTFWKAFIDYHSNVAKGCNSV